MQNLTKEEKKSFQIIVAGSAGEGSKKAGMIIAKLFNELGFSVFIHEDYESVIKGGHNFSQIVVSLENENAVSEKIDFLLAINKESVEKHKTKVKEDGFIICDKEDVDNEEDSKAIKVSVKEIIEEAEATGLMKNTALLSSFFKIVGIDKEVVKNILQKEFSFEIEKNIKVAEIAFEKVEKIKEIKAGENTPMPLVSGNVAVALGAVDAGVSHCVAYPMTPSTGIMMFLSKTEGVRTVQAENEIGAVNMAIGMAYSGKRTIVGTSGGGYALMTETVSLSAQSETPLFIALSQRMGPATGVPTYGSQGDLLFVLNSGHGDMMRFVASPGDVNEAYLLSGKCLNLAWKYQMPSVLLLDKDLSEDTYRFWKEEVVKKEDFFLGEDNENYNRYDGEDISPLLFPGGEAVIKATGYEHDRKGIATEEAEEIVKMQEKRMRKYEKLKKEVEEMEAVKTYQDSEVAVVFWGSTKGAVLEALKEVDAMGVQPIILQPFPEKKIKEVLLSKKKVICVENNSTGQMAQLLQSFGIKVDKKILKYNGRPFTKEELLEKIKEEL